VLAASRVVVAVMRPSGNNATFTGGNRAAAARKMDEEPGERDIRWRYLRACAHVSARASAFALNQRTWVSIPVSGRSARIRLATIWPRP